VAGLPGKDTGLVGMTHDIYRAHNSSGSVNWTALISYCVARLRPVVLRWHVGGCMVRQLLLSRKTGPWLAVTACSAMKVM